MKESSKLQLQTPVLSRLISMTFNLDICVCVWGGGGGGYRQGIQYYDYISLLFPGFNYTFFFELVIWHVLTLAGEIVSVLSK